MSVDKKGIVLKVGDEVLIRAKMVPSHSEFKRPGVESFLILDPKGDNESHPLISLNTRVVERTSSAAVAAVKKPAVAPSGPRPVLTGTAPASVRPVAPAPRPPTPPARPSILGRP